MSTIFFYSLLQFFDGWDIQFLHKQITFDIHLNLKVILNKKIDKRKNV